MKNTILMVDDDADFAETMGDALSAHGYAVETCGSGVAALARLAEKRVDIVVADLQMEGMTGLELCSRIRKEHPDVLVMLLTGSTLMESAIAALQAGAWDFVCKPVQADVLALSLARASEHLLITREVHRLRDHVLREARMGIAGDSTQATQLRMLIDRIAASDASVLITGESGTGKELVARAIHQLSRPSERFIAINCAAMPAELLESELFGHAQGAFTDAKSSREGLFVTARAGTIFLDEIGEMPLSMQVKLLRVLQERTVRPVGGGAEVEVKARILTATNRNLEQEIAARRFREDLYYRINVVQIEVPPLRERSGDILFLAQLFLERAAARCNKGVRGISAWAARRLTEYDWPGNIRELENCMERAVALCRLDEITVDDLPEKVSRPNTVITETLDELVTLDEMIGRYVRKVLGLARGNKTRAAGLLGIDRRSLYRHLQYAQTAEHDRIANASIEVAQEKAQA